jgi:hypothetical protein
MFLPEAIEYCRKHGYPVSLEYELDGIDTWRVDAPRDDPAFKDPEFISLLIKQSLESAKLLAKRLAPPVYVPRIGGYVAYSERPGRTGEKTMYLPMARTDEPLKHLLTNPQTGECPAICEITALDQLLTILEAALCENVEAINYFVKPRMAESIPIRHAITVLAKRKNAN